MACVILSSLSAAENDNRLTVTADLETQDESQQQSRFLQHLPPPTRDSNMWPTVRPHKSDAREDDDKSKHACLAISLMNSCMKRVVSH